MQDDRTQPDGGGVDDLRLLEQEASRLREAIERSAHDARSAPDAAAVGAAMRRQFDAEDGLRNVQARIDSGRAERARRAAAEAAPAAETTSTSKARTDGRRRSNISPLKLAAVAGLILALCGVVGGAVVAWIGWRIAADQEAARTPVLELARELEEPFVSFGYDPLDPQKAIRPVAAESAADPAHARMPTRSLVGHRGGVDAIVFHPRDGRLASASYDETIRIWDFATGKCLQTLTTDPPVIIDSLAIGDEGRLLFGASGQVRTDLSAWRAWDFDSGGRMLSDQIGRPIERLAASATSATTYGVRVDPEGRRSLVAWQFDEPRQLWETPIAVPPRPSTTDLRLSPQGDLLATAVERNRVLLVDPSTGLARRTLDTRLYDNLRLDFSADGKLLAVCALGHRGKQYVAPDRYLGPSGADYYGQVQWWEVESGRLVARLTWRGHDPPAAVALRADGVLAAVASGDTVQVWDVRIAARTHVLRGHRSTCLAFSPDGKSLVSGGAPDRFAPLDNPPVLLVWDLDSPPVDSTAPVAR